MAPKKLPVKDVPTGKPQVFLEFSHRSEPLGRVMFELFHEQLPKTVENFKQFCMGTTIGDKKSKEVRTAHYKGCKFLRVTEDGIQTGDVLNRADGKGQESIFGPQFEDECLGVVAHNHGVLSMCNSGPHSNGCQFFICTIPDGSSQGKAAHLDAHYVAFGILVEGAAVLETLSRILTTYVIDKHGHIDLHAEVEVSNCGLHTPSISKPVSRPASAGKK